MQNISLHSITVAEIANSTGMIAYHFIPLLLSGNGNENRNLSLHWCYITDQRDLSSKGVLQLV